MFRLGPDAAELLPAMRESLQGLDPFSESLVVAYLMKLGARGEVEALDMWRSSRPWERQLALEVLSALWGESARFRDLICQALGDEDAGVRRVAALALIGHRPHSAMTSGTGFQRLHYDSPWNRREPVRIPSRVDCGTGASNQWWVALQGELTNAVPERRFEAAAALTLGGAADGAVRAALAGLANMEPYNRYSRAPYARIVALARGSVPVEPDEP
jgi:hypothetical protein